MNPLFAPRSGRQVRAGAGQAGDTLREIIGPPMFQVTHRRQLTVPGAVKPEIWAGEDRTIAERFIAPLAGAVLVEGRTTDGKRIERAYQPRDKIELTASQFFANEEDLRRMRAWILGDPTAWL